MNRREFLVGSAASVSAGVAERKGFAKGVAVASLPPFPRDFLFGAATSCVQIEGAAWEDGKGESIWDCFAEKPGAIIDGSNPSLACDSYHQWSLDLALVKEMGLQSYRFSIAWPRILPIGRGQVNERGVDHYNKIIDALLSAGIQPLVTAYHWDLPQVLQDKGGWPNRDTAERFADYVQILAKRFGDRVVRWCLLNEPSAFTIFAYGFGGHAPGIRDRGQMLRAIHTSNLAQGAAFRAMKAIRPHSKVGIAHAMQLYDPATSSETDRQACERFHAFNNLWFLDPAFTGEYPDAFVNGVPYEEMGWKPGDEQRVRATLDFSGMNFYGDVQLVAAGAGKFMNEAELLNGIDAHVTRRQRNTAAAMERVSLWMATRYSRPVEITETGFGGHDVLTPKGKVHDQTRIIWLSDAFSGIRRAQLKGAKIVSAHVWSLIDDWEWQGGFRIHMGLAWVDFMNPIQRIPKDSARWYGNLVRSRSLTPTHR
ncbi:MAG TPA: family 1 glycosylhydrolase [Alloacidobacterium sp.]|nr:family 1 glycosylhydrolase [Alloacidobacterium sp.]